MHGFNVLNFTRSSNLQSFNQIPFKVKDISFQSKRCQPSKIRIEMADSVHISDVS